MKIALSYCRFSNKIKFNLIQRNAIFETLDFLSSEKEHKLINHESNNIFWAGVQHYTILLKTKGKKKNIHNQTLLMNFFIVKKYQGKCIKLNCMIWSNRYNFFLGYFL